MYDNEYQTMAHHCIIMHMITSTSLRDALLSRPGYSATKSVAPIAMKYIKVATQRFLAVIFLI